MPAVFREKSLERMKSPEKLDEYIHVSNPSVWVILGAIVLLLVAAIVWACAGTITERAQAIVVVTSDEVAVYVAQSSAEDVVAGQTVEVTENLSGAQVEAAGVLTELSDQPIATSAIASTSTADVIAAQLGSPSWLVGGTVSLTSGEELPNGAYKATVITSSYQPISLLLGGA